MADLGPEMRSRLRSLVETEYSDSDSLRVLVLDTVEDSTDYEHLVTFLEQSPSALHRKFASDVRTAFEEVLRSRLLDVEAEQGRIPDDLYYGLLDLHLVDGLGEELMGFLTLNYDEFLEHAVRRSPLHQLDPGIPIGDTSDLGPRRVPVLKLHGSFGWSGGLPVRETPLGKPVWIPPGIQKDKHRYPFNLLWGAARELLDCDVLRIIGCNLGANDWDLISLLFTSRLADGAGPRFQIEVIDAPDQSAKLKRHFPYLDVRPILELDEIGPSLIAEYHGPAGVEFLDLTAPQREAVLQNAGRGSQNWFWIWLKQKAELLYADSGTLHTELGEIERLMETH